MKELIRTIIALGASKLPKGILTDQKFFELYQSKGWHATPVHFYQPIPNTQEISDNIWDFPSDLVGINTNINTQLELLENFSNNNYLMEYHSIPEEPPQNTGEYTRFCGFSGMDGAILYSMIREYKPKKIIEIGSGYSTLLSKLALQKNIQDDPSKRGEITAIEPYPKDFLKDSLKGIGQLISEKVENVPLSEFEGLEENDILFIDSSHVVKIGGDVNYEILEIVPRLKKGVLVHFHDIFLPFQYPKEWVKKRHTFWTEQYLLQAFLAFNRHFEIIWSQGCMRAHMSDKLSMHFPYYDPSRQQGGSFWIRRCK